MLSLFFRKFTKTPKFKIKLSFMFHQFSILYRDTRWLFKTACSIDEKTGGIDKKNKSDSGSFGEEWPESSWAVNSRKVAWLIRWFQTNDKMTSRCADQKGARKVWYCLRLYSCSERCARPLAEFAYTLCSHRPKWRNVLVLISFLASRINNS